MKNLFNRPYYLMLSIKYYFQFERFIKTVGVDREFIERFFNHCGHGNPRNDKAPKWFRNYLAGVFKKYRSINKH